MQTAATTRHTAWSLLLALGLSLTWGCGGEDTSSSASPLQEICDDGADNDGDALTDCDDPDCDATRRCRLLAVGEICDDSLDNDEDALTDCDDPDCAEARSCQPDPTPEVCGDALDNDGDQLTDCDDPDCAQEAGCQPDPDPTPEVCDDGADNDGDTFTDCADPDCAAHPTCQPDPDPELCDDDADNDADGDADCDDEDCAAHPTCQPDPDPEICDDGDDNDGDTLTDCADPDCAAHPTCQPDPDPEICDDSADNDGDTLTDCDDPDCAEHPTCQPDPDPELCDDDADNDGDTFTDCADPDCTDHPTCQPDPDPEVCDDGADNDGDTFTDCADPDCAEHPTCQPDPDPEVCDDGADNDGDTFTDCADPDCALAQRCGPQGPGTCGAPYRFKSVGAVTGSTLGGSDNAQGTCGGAGFEEVWSFEVPAASTVCLDTKAARYDTVLYVRAGRCGDPAAEAACGDDLTTGPVQSQLQLNAEPGVTYFVFVDSFAGGGDYTLALTPGPCDQAEDCGDGLDNDQSGAADCADPACADDPRCQGSFERCDDGLDNNGDGLEDCADPACAANPSCQQVLRGTCEHPLELDDSGMLRNYIWFQSSTSLAPITYRGSCSSSAKGPEDVWRLVTETTTAVCVSALNTNPGLYSLGFHVRRGVCESAALEVACVATEDLFPDGVDVQFTATAGVPYYVIAETGLFFDSVDNDIDNSPGQRLDLNADLYELQVRYGPCAVDPAPEVCDDSLDNDQDGRADCLDADCAAALACRTGEGTCAQPLRLSSAGTHGGELTQAASAHQGSCGEDGAEESWSFTAAEDGPLCFIAAGAAAPLALYVRGDGCEAGAELGCATAAPSATAQVEVDAVTGQTYAVFVDGASGAYSLEVHPGSCASVREVCHDGLDNDQDGAIDCLDTSCRTDITCARVEQGTCRWPLEITGGGTFEGTFALARNEHRSPCTSTDPTHDPEEVWTLRTDHATPVCAKLDAYDAYTALYVRQLYCDRELEIDCDAQGGPRSRMPYRPDNPPSQIEFEAQAGVPYFLFAEGVGQSTRGPYKLDVRFGPCDTTPSPEVCDDGVDNDQDSFIDCDDPDCRATSSCVTGSGTCAAPFVLEIGAGGYGALEADAGSPEVGSCGGDGAAQVWSFTAPVASPVCFETIGSTFDTVLTVRGASCASAELGCSDDISFLNNRSQVEVAATADQRFTLLIDGYDAARLGAYALAARLGPCAVAPTRERCDDDLDNDQDGAADCADADCTRTEACAPIAESACDDNDDEDLDGLTDCADPDCQADPTCLSLEPGTCERPLLLAAEVRGDTSLRSDEHDGSCLSNSSQEEIWLLQPLRSATVCLELDELSFDGGLYARSARCDLPPDLACADRGGFGTSERLELQVEADERYYVFVDTYGSSSGGTYRLRTRYGACATAPSPEVCDDGVDNDQDGPVDCDDPSCDLSPLCVSGSGTCEDPFGLVEPGRSGESTGAPAVRAGTCGGAGPEEVWSFTAADDGPLCLSTAGSAYDTVLYVRSGECAMGPELACNDNTVGVTSRVEINAAAGMTYFAFVDARDAASQGGTYSLDLLPGACADFVEACDDDLDNDRDGLYDCADDDCLGDIACLELCDDNIDNDLNGLKDCADPACIGAPSCAERDGTCAAPLLLDRAGTFSGDTSAAPSDHVASCRNVDGMEAVWLLQTERDTPVCITATADYSRSLYVRQGTCAFGAEIRCNEGLNNPTRVEFPAAAHTPYFVFMDGLNGGASFAGPYQLNVRFGPCATAPSPEVCDDGLDNDQDGEVDCDDPGCTSDGACLMGAGTCGAPFVLASSGSAQGQPVPPGNAHAGSCGGGEGDEAVWSFEVPETGVYCLDTAGSGFDTVLYVREGTCVGGEEVGCDDDGLRPRSQVELLAQAGMPYYAFLDARRHTAGPAQLNLTPGPCAARVEVCDDGLDNDQDGGADCADPDCAEALTCPLPEGTCALPFVLEETGSFSGDTTGAASLHEGVCRPVDGPEEVWVFQTEQDTPVCIRATGSAGALYVRSGGCAGGGYDEAVCLYGASNPQAQLQAIAGRPYFVFIDSSNGATFGPYTLSVRYGPCATAPSPEVCDDGVDNDQNGRIDCIDPACSAEARCIVGSGQCADPFIMSRAGSFSRAIDGAANNDQGSCGGDGPEAFWSYTPTTSGLLCLSTLGSTYDTVLYARADACAQGSELTCDDDTVGAAAEIEVSAQAGVPFLFGVDARDAALSSGTYQLHLFEGACASRVEVCGNGADDDLDGAADCDDADCDDEPSCPAGAIPIAAPGGSITLDGALEASDPTWSRPGESCTAGSPGFFYDLHAIRNASATPQTITVTASWLGDGYLHLYRPPFDPVDRSTCLLGDDDFNGTRMSQIANHTLNPGEVIFVVASSYNPSDALGAYTIQVQTP